MKKIINILIILSTIHFLNSCSGFSNFLKSNNKIDGFKYALDTAKSYKKSIFSGRKVSQQNVNLETSNEEFLRDFKMNQYIYELVLSNDSNGTKSNVNEGKDYEFLEIKKEGDIMKISLSKHEKSLFYEIQKYFFLTFRKNKIVSKSVKENEKFAWSEELKFEVNYKYSYN